MKVQIEELIKNYFIDADIRQLKCYKIYKESLKIKKDLNNTLTYEQQTKLFLFWNKYTNYLDEYVMEFADYLIKCLKQLYNQ